MPKKIFVREKILIAAVELAQTIGLQRVSQAQAAKQAGVRQSHLTYYFPMRVDLIKATLEKICIHISEENKLTTVKDDNGTHPPVDTLRKFFTAEVCNEPRVRLIMSVMYASQEYPELNNWFELFDEETTTRFSKMFRNHGIIVSDKEVHLFHATLIGAGIQALHLNTNNARKRASETIGTAFDRLVKMAEKN